MNPSWAERKLLAGETPRVVAVVRLAWADTGAGPSSDQISDALGWDSSYESWAIAELQRLGVLTGTSGSNSLRVVENETGGRHWPIEFSLRAGSDPYDPRGRSGHHHFTETAGATRTGNELHSGPSSAPDHRAALGDESHNRHPGEQDRRNRAFLKFPIRRQRLLSDVLG